MPSGQSMSPTTRDSFAVLPSEVWRPIALDTNQPRTDFSFSRLLPSSFLPSPTLPSPPLSFPLPSPLLFLSFHYVAQAGLQPVPQSPELGLQEESPNPFSTA